MPLIKLVGVANVIAKANAEGKFNFLPTHDPIDMLGWVAALLTIALGSIPQQDVFQRVNAAKSESIAIWGTALGGIAYFFFASVPLFLAYTAIMIDPQMVNKFLAMDSQMILPTLILDHMPLYIQVIFFWGAHLCDHEYCFWNLTSSVSNLYRKYPQRFLPSHDG